MKTSGIKIGSRGSKLALLMAHEVKDALIAAHQLPQESVSVEAITTSGDRIQTIALSEVGGKGLFTQEIEVALMNGDIDIAVHSTKDMPTKLPDGLHLNAFMTREDPRDAFIGAKVQKFYDLPQGAVIGTAGLRRQALVKKLRPDLQTTLFRGNVDTRLKKVQNGEVDGTFLAMAGLNRLGLTSCIGEIMEADDFVPAPGQGAIAIETRIGDSRIDHFLSAIADDETKTALICERAFLASLDGSCRTPLGAYAYLDGATLHFHGLILSPDGKQYFETRQSGPIGDAASIGDDAAKELRAQAGERFFDSW